jgi:hypothetical protein
MMSSKGPDDLILRTLEQIHGTLLELGKSVAAVSQAFPSAGSEPGLGVTLTKPVGVVAGDGFSPDGHHGELEPLVELMRNSVDTLREIKEAVAASPGRQAAAMEPQAHALAEVAQTLKSLASQDRGYGESIPGVKAEELRAGLGRLQQGIEELQPYLGELAARLRRLADPSHPVRYRVEVRSSAVGN